MGGISWLILLNIIYYSKGVNPKTWWWIVSFIIWPIGFLLSICMSLWTLKDTFIEFLFIWESGWAHIIDGVITVLSFTLLRTHFSYEVGKKVARWRSREELKIRDLRR
jgi:hypothetical protein